LIVDLKLCNRTGRSKDIFVKKGPKKYPHPFFVKTIAQYKWPTAIEISITFEQEFISFRKA
jgi:hypothetical protein